MGEQKIKLMDELREIRFRATDIKGYQERIARLDSLRKRCTPVYIEGSKGTGTQDRMADLTAKIDELEEVLADKIIDVEARTQAVESEVDKLSRYHREVIKYRDFKGMTWAEVATEMSYSIQHCKRIYSYAREAIRFITIRCDTMRRETDVKC